MTHNNRRSLPESVQYAVAGASTQPVLEGVPSHMMELFTDAQWPELVFQLQPSLRLVETENGSISDKSSSDQPVSWVVFKTSAEVLVRPAIGRDIEGLSLIMAGKNFDQVAAALWPNQLRSRQRSGLTDLLFRWLEEGLITDAGVPIPKDARFEPDPDDATRSYASSRAPKTESR